MAAPVRRRKPEVVPERVGDEGREDHRPYTMVFRTYRRLEEVIEALAPSSYGRRDLQRRRDVDRRDAAQLVENIANVEVRDLAMEHIRHAAEQASAAMRTDPAPDPR